MSEIQKSNDYAYNKRIAFGLAHRYSPYGVTVDNDADYKKQVGKDLYSNLSDLYLLDNSTVNNILHQIHEMDENNDWYGNGFNGKVYLVEHPETGKKVVIVKALLENTHQTERIVSEYNYQLKAYELLENKNLYKVPKPHGVLHNDKGEALIVMDYIEGMTVFSYKISQSLPIIYDQLYSEILEQGDDELRSEFTTTLGTKESITNLRTDREIKSAIIKIFDFANARMSDSEFVNEYLYEYSTDRRIGGTFFESKLSKIYNRLKENHPDLYTSLGKQSMEKMLDAGVETLSLLKKNNIYHNDLNNSRNIILGEDGYVYLIDFDKADSEESARIKEYKRRGPVKLKEYKGVQFQGDANCLKILSGL